MSQFLFCIISLTLSIDPFFTLIALGKALQLFRKIDSADEVIFILAAPILWNVLSTSKSLFSEEFSKDGFVFRDLSHNLLKELE